MILTYHAIEKAGTERGNDLYCVSFEKFKEQIELISRDCPRRGLSLQVKITFDDGDITNYTYAYPLMKEKGMKAHFFILVSKVGTPGYMDWQQIKELRDAGMVIGSHGMGHRILTVLNEKELDYELKESKKILEQQLGNEVKYLSIPRGFYDRRVIRKSQEAGYKTIFTSNPGDNNGFLLGRIAIRSTWDAAKFERVMDNGLSLSDLAEELIKNFLKKLFGANNYDKMRNNLLK